MIIVEDSPDQEHFQGCLSVPRSIAYAARQDRNSQIHSSLPQSCLGMAMHHYFFKTGRNPENQIIEYQLALMCLTTIDPLSQSNLRHCYWKAQMTTIETHFHSSSNWMDYSLGWNCLSNFVEAVKPVAVAVYCPQRPIAVSSTTSPVRCVVVAIAFIFPFEFLN